MMCLFWFWSWCSPSVFGKPIIALNAVVSLLHTAAECSVLHKSSVIFVMWINYDAGVYAGHSIAYCSSWHLVSRCGEVMLLSVLQLLLFYLKYSVNMRIVVVLKVPYDKKAPTVGEWILPTDYGVNLWLLCSSLVSIARRLLPLLQLALALVAWPEILSLNLCFAICWNISIVCGFMLFHDINCWMIIQAVKL